MFCKRRLARLETAIRKGPHAVLRRHSRISYNPRHALLSRSRYLATTRRLRILSPFRQALLQRLHAPRRYKAAVRTEKTKRDERLAHVSLPRSARGKRDRTVSLSSATRQGLGP